MHALTQSIRFALRQLRKSPAFALTAIFTIALGVGATTAIYTLIHQVMMRELPVDHPEQLWKIGKEDECCNDGGLQGDWRIFSYDLYTYFRDNTPGFKSLAAFQSGQSGFNVRRAGDDHPAEPITGRYVSGNYFSTLGAQVVLGRAIAPEDDRDGAPAVAVLGYRLWQQKFGSDRSLVGSTLMLNGKAVTVIGVAAPSFYGEQLDSDPPQMWLPLHQEPILTTSWTLLKRPQNNWLDVIGRVPPGTDPHKIEAQLRVELRQWLQTQAGQFRPEEQAQFGQQTTELASAATGVNLIKDAYQSGLHMLMAVAAVVLLIACANVANLMLVRGMNRRQETAVRAALGASRGKLVSQMLIESVVLSVFGGFAALFLSFAAAKLILALVFRDAKFVPIDAQPSLPVLGFALLVSVVTGILFGCAPAWLASHAQPADALRGNARSTKGGSTLPQKVLIIVQAGLSVVLLCCAGWLAMSLRNLWHQHYGFDSDATMIVSINPGLAGYKVDQLPSLYQRIDSRLRAVPGVETMSYALYTPMAHNNWGTTAFIPGQPLPDPNSDWYNASWLRVGPDYFKALGTKLLSGRAVLDSDTDRTQRVAVVNRTFADRFFHGNAIGQHFGLEPELNTQFEIVGVVEDAKYRNPHQPVPPMFFLPMSQTAKMMKAEDQEMEQFSHFAGQVVVRFAGDPSNMAQQVRKAFSEVDPNLSIPQIDTLREELGTNLTQDILLSRLTLLFGGVALLLAAIGLYGVTAYAVARRTAEIGLRMALGANRLKVLQLVLHGAFLQVAIGLLIGVPAALLAARAMQSSLYGVHATNPTVLAATVAVLATAALVAAFLPARRAASIDPMQALRTE